MDPVKVRPFRPYEKRELRRLKRQRSNAVNSHRARVLLLSRGGIPNKEIAGRVGFSPQWVRVLIHRFNTDGLCGILWYPWLHANHRPRRFLTEVKEQIADVALSSPKALIGMTRWSLAKLRDYLVEQDIVPSLSLEWLRTLLRRLGIRWRRTKTWKESTDPEFWPKYQRLRRLYRRRPKGGRRLCLDEFGPLNLLPRAGACLAGRKKKVERHRATYSRKGGVRHWLAAYDLEDDRLLGQFHPRKTWVEFLGFLKWLRRRYPAGQTLHLVMDNYGPHKKVEVVTWAWANKVKLYFTPTNASWLNRIECQFTALKEFALSNSDYRTHEELQEAIESYVEWRNGDRPLTKSNWRAFKRRQSKR
jgi:transposase